MEASPRGKGAPAREPTPIPEPAPARELAPVPEGAAFQEKAFAGARARGSKRPAPAPPSPDKLALTPPARTTSPQKRNKQFVKRRLAASYDIPVELTVDSQDGGSRAGGSQDDGSLVAQCSQRSSSPPWACGQGSVKSAHYSSQSDPDMTCAELTQADAAERSQSVAAEAVAAPPDAAPRRLTERDLLCTETMGAGDAGAPAQDSVSLAKLEELINKMCLNLAEVHRLQDTSSALLCDAQNVFDRAEELKTAAENYKDEVKMLREEAQEERTDAQEESKLAHRLLEDVRRTSRDIRTSLKNLKTEFMPLVEAAELAQQVLPALKQAAARGGGGGNGAIAANFDAYNAGVCSPPKGAPATFVKASALLKASTAPSAPERRSPQLRLDTSVGCVQSGGLSVRSKEIGPFLNFDPSTPPRGAGAGVEEAPKARRYGSRTKRNALIYHSDVSASDPEDDAPPTARNLHQRSFHAVPVAQRQPSYRPRTPPRPLADAAVLGVSPQPRGNDSGASYVPETPRSPLVDLVSPAKPAPPRRCAGTRIYVHRDAARNDAASGDGAADSPASPVFGESGKTGVADLWNRRRV